MKIKEVTYGRTFSQNYQSRRVEVTIAAERPSDTYEDMLDTAKKIVDNRLALDEGRDRTGLK